jgi:hypothetical protein
MHALWIFLLLLALVVLAVGSALTGRWLIQHAVEPYKDPNALVVAVVLRV